MRIGSLTRTRRGPSPRALMLTICASCEIASTRITWRQSRAERTYGERTYTTARTERLAVEDTQGTGAALDQGGTVAASSVASVIGNTCAPIVARYGQEQGHHQSEALCLRSTLGEVVTAAGQRFGALERSLHRERCSATELAGLKGPQGYRPTMCPLETASEEPDWLPDPGAPLCSKQAHWWLETEFLAYLAALDS